jgi:RNA polymerase sigma factor (sigma-70 family)
MAGFGSAKGGAGDQETGAERDEGFPGDARTSGTLGRLGPRPVMPPPEVPDAPCADIHDVIRVYQRAVHRFVARAGLGEDTNDVVQEVFVDADLYLRGHSMPAKVRPWIFTFAWRKTIDAMRGRRHQQRRRSETGADEVPASQSTSEDYVDLKRIAEAAFATMSEEEILMVRQGVGDSEEHGAMTEAAKRMGIAPSTLSSKASRARGKFVAAIQRIYKKDLGGNR